MCCIYCRNQKRVLNQTKIFYVQGNQENRHRCATLADIFLEPKKRVNDIEHLLSYYLLTIIYEILLNLLKNDFYSLWYNK